MNVEAVSMIAVLVMILTYCDLKHEVYYLMYLEVFLVWLPVTWQSFHAFLLKIFPYD